MCVIVSYDIKIARRKPVMASRSRRRSSRRSIPQISVWALLLVSIYTPSYGWGISKKRSCQLCCHFLSVTKRTKCLG